MKSSIYHIAIAFDRNYYRQFFALSSSIFFHHSRGEIIFHAIVTGITNPEKETIVDFVKSHDNDIYFYSIDEGLLRRFVLINNWTHAVYYRLFLPLVISPNVSRILYLDMDTLVINSLKEFWNQEIGSFPVAAAYDNYVKTQPLLGIHEEGEYFNSGVLLINRPVWIEQQVSERTFEYLMANPEKIRFVDQCGLNAVLHKNWFKLPEKFNFIYSSLPPAASKLELKKLTKSIVIVHYTLQRPWHMLCRNRLAYLYYQYLKMSPIGKQVPRFDDFSFQKLPAFLKIKILNLYFDLPWLAFIWRGFKRISHDKASNSPSA